MAGTSVTSVLGLSTSPSTQYSPEMPMGLAHTGMSSEVMQSQPMSGHHSASWYSIPPTTTTYGPGPVVTGSPFDEWPGPNSGSPLSSNSPCIGGSPASALPPCAYGHAMNMVNAASAYGQSIGSYHSHTSVHRPEHYPDHLHSHHHFHPHVNAGLIQPGNIHGNATPVHPSPDSGLTASSDGGTESPNGQQNHSSSWINSTPNGIIKQENLSNNNNSCSVRPQPARSPYEWMKKPSYQNQVAPGKTRTKDKYRVVYSDHQRLELEKEFHYSRYITIKRKSELACMLGLSERQVKIWFQNRRAKERKQAKKREEMIRKDNKDHINHVVNNHTQQLHSLHGLIN